MENYTEKEFLDSFTRAFRDGKADCLMAMLPGAGFSERRRNGG